jgi:hypothetical protein
MFNSATLVQDRHARLDHFGRDFSLGRASVYGPWVAHVTEYTTKMAYLQ